MNPPIVSEAVYRMGFVGAGPCSLPAFFAVIVSNPVYTQVKGLRSVEVNIALRKRDYNSGVLELVVYRLVKFAGG